MILDDKTRGTFEHEIDKIIKQIPGLIKLARNEEFRKDFHIKDVLFCFLLENL